MSVPHPTAGATVARPQEAPCCEPEAARAPDALPPDRSSSPSSPGELSEVDLEAVDRIIAQQGREPDALIPILQALQKHFRYLPEAALRRVAERTHITPAAIAGVSTFYTRFRHQPVGKHVISVCHGTACHVKGAVLVTEALRRHLKLEDDRDTTPDGLFTIQRVDCLGCCTLAPVMQVDGVTYGHLTPDAVAEVLEDFLVQEARAATAATPTPATPVGGLAEVRIGVGSCCIAGGSMDVRRALEEAIGEAGVPVAVRPVGCVGMCHQTPLVEVVIPGQPPATYARVQAQDAPAIIWRHFAPRGLRRKIAGLLDRTLDAILTDEAWEPVTRYAIDVRDQPVCAFLGPQKHIATELCGMLDPLDLDAYVAHGGFAALRHVLSRSMTPEEVIATIKASGLRGRGGAGFPTGEKWEAVRRAADPTRFIICNGDEGDPGAFMDRMLLESYPFRVLEGMIIAAYAVGASQGALYIRHEYPLAVRRVWEAIRRCEQRGLLGQDILGSGFSLSLTIVEGAGAFVAGEETALIAALEGRRAMARLRPPYPAQSGLWGHPTLVNNVETLAVVPWIIRNGPQAFAELGTEHSKGTKVFSLAGKVMRGGLIEVPMGTTIRQIVEDIGGGVAPGRTLKAVQIGGPSGGCIPAHLTDTPIDYGALAGLGAIMGSGGLVVMDDTDCMVDVARYFLEFTQRESCGKCTFCRVGTRKMLDILERICTGQGRRNDLEELQDLAHGIKHGSLCGLGRTAPNPILTTLRYFRHEYEAHLQGRCPAGRCKALITYSITEDCIGCTRCAQECPAGAIDMRPYRQHVINPEQCIRCDTCRQVCAFGAVRVT